MRNILKIGLTAFWAMAGIATAANYGVFVGLNQYNSSYIGSSSWLDGCVPDAMHVYMNATQRGSWTAGNSQVLTNALGTRTRIRQAISNYAATAVSGDVFLYFHSSHGGNNDWPYSTSVYLCAYDADYSDTLLAQDLAKFATGVKVVVMVDACHSGGILAVRSGETEPVLSQYYSMLAKSVSGTALIMSSKAEETSLESAGLRQGVFSHFLIRGLKGEADKDHDKAVTVEELYNYIFENVRTYTGNRQSPVIKGTYDPKMPVSVLR